MCSHEVAAKEKYLGSGTILKNAIKRHGKENFKRKILQECNTREELEAAEKKWIAKFDASNSVEYYNISEGGMGGNSNAMQKIWDNRTEKERKAIGSKVSASRKKLGLAKGEKNPMFGKSTSDVVRQVWNERTLEQRKLIGEKISKRRKELDLDMLGKNNPMYGRSAINERNLKWYTNGKENKYITEGKQPTDWWRGRTNLSGKIGKRKS